MKLRKYLKTCTEVYHTTLDPQKPGVARIHLVPPDKPTPGKPWVVIVNGYSILPLMSSWAVLLKEFIAAVNQTDGKPLSNEDISELVRKTMDEVRKVFPKTSPTVLRQDLGQIVGTLRALAVGREPPVETGYMTLAAYAKYMSAPHRMDLLVSPMTVDGNWNCNQRCLHCYAANQPQACCSQLTTAQWKQVIDNCRKARIPAITFTGGEPTMRDDLVELIDYSRWFVTRLNTNGVRLSLDLCKQLADASLDSVQVTLYSHDFRIHNGLVGSSHFFDTVEGIKNAVAAGLDVSINTPLCSLNASDYVETIKFARGLGVKYFSCSGLIPAGHATTADSTVTALTQKQITAVVKEAFAYTSTHDAELSFTSPGWIADSVLKKLHMVVPSCGACLSNMAVAPDGSVVPCQSWLSDKPLGNMLTDKWNKIWKSARCKEIRSKSACTHQKCLLKEEK